MGDGRPLAAVVFITFIGSVFSENVAVMINQDLIFINVIIKYQESNVINVHVYN